MFRVFFSWLLCRQFQMSRCAFWALKIALRSSFWCFLLESFWLLWLVHFWEHWTKTTFSEWLSPEVAVVLSVALTVVITIILLKVELGKLAVRFLQRRKTVKAAETLDWVSSSRSFILIVFWRFEEEASVVIVTWQSHHFISQTLL